MAKTPTVDKSNLQPKSPSITSTFVLGSDLPLEGIDLGAAAGLVREHEEQPLVSSSPAKHSGPPSAEKLNRLRADEKVSVNFDPPAPQKLFARPPSAGQPAAVGSFLFGKVNRRSGISTQSSVKQSRKDSQASQQDEPSKQEQEESTTKASPITVFDIGDLDIRPPHMVKEAEARARQAAQVPDKGLAITASGDNRKEDLGNVASTGVSHSPSSAEPTTFETARLTPTSGGGQSTSKRLSPGARASQSSATEDEIDHSCLKDVANSNNSSELENRGAQEPIQNYARNVVQTIENETLRTGHSSEPASRCDHHTPVTMLSKVLEPARVTKNSQNASKTFDKILRAQGSAVSLTDVCSEEDLFALLLSRSRQRRKDNDRTAVKQRQMVATINQLCQANDHYQSQLKHAQENEGAHMAIIEKQKRACEDVKTKFAVLKNFVKGVSNDVESVRKDGNAIRRCQSDLEKSRDDLAEDKHKLRIVNNKSLDRMTQMHHAIAELRCNLDSSLASNARLQTAIEVEEGRLREEKEKTGQLKQEMESTKSASGEHLKLIESRQKLLTERVESLPLLIEKLGDRSALAASDKSMLQECLEMVKSLCSVERLVPADMQNLETSVVSRLMDRMETILEGTAAVTRSYCNDSKTAYGHLCAQLSEIVRKIQSASDSQDRVSKLQEAQYRLEERLTAKTDELNHSASNVTELRDRERYLLESIPQLKNDLQAIRDKCASNPSSPGKEASIEHWKCLVEEYRVRWMSVNSEKVDLMKDLMSTTNTLKEQSGLLENHQRAIETLSSENTQLKKEIENSQEKLDAFNSEEIDRLRTVVSEQETEIRSMASELLERTQSLQDNRQEIEDLGNQREDLESKLAHSQHQHDIAINNAQDLNVRNEKLLQDMSEVDDLRAQAEQTSHLTSELEREKRTTAEQATSIYQLQQRLETLEADLANKSSENTQLSKQIEDQKKLHRSIERLTDEVEQSQSTLTAMQAESARDEERADRVSDSESQLSKATEQLDEYRNESNNNGTKLEESENHCVELQERLHGIEEKLKILEDESNLKEEELTNLRSELSHMDTIKADGQRKDDEILGLNNKLESLYQVLCKERTPNTQYTTPVNGRYGLPNGHTFKSPIQAILDESQGEPIPGPPRPPRTYQLADIHRILDSIQLVRRSPVESESSDTTAAIDSQTVQRTQDHGTESSCDLTDPSGPDLHNSFRQSSGINRFRQSLTDYIDDSQPSMPLETPTLPRRTSSGARRAANEASEMSHPSTPGEEMLFDSQSQTGGFAGTTQSSTPNEAESSRYANEGADTPSVTPKPNSGKTAFSKSSATAASKATSNRPKDRSIKTSAGNLQGTRNPAISATKANSMPQMSATLNEQSSSSNIANNVSPASKHQPNSKAKRQHESDTETESPDRSSNKILKRNASAIGTRRSGPANVSFFDQTPESAAGTSTAHPSHSALPAGSKAGSIGNKSSSGNRSTQKQNKNPKQGSTAKRYANRFS